MATLTAQRVAAFRAKRAEMGLSRLDIYAHPDDHKDIKAFVTYLTHKRFTPNQKRKPCKTSD